MANSETNPLLRPFTTPDESIPYSEIRTEHFLPAMQEGIRLSKILVAALRDSKDPVTFENTIVALEASSEPLDIVSDVYFNLLSAEADDAYHALAKELSPLVAAFANDVLLDEKLFLRVKAVWDKVDSLGLNLEQRRLAEKTYKNFVRNGANLDAKAKSRLREVDAEMARLSPQFSENVLKATYAFDIEITDVSQLEGLPPSAIEAAASAAEKKGKKNAWIFSLEAPSYIPVVTYSAIRELRERMYRAYNSRAFGGGHDNREVLKSIIKLRHERAQILGYATHADYVLEERMAGSRKKVMSFLDRLLSVCKSAAEREFEEVRAFARATQGPLDLQPWDFAYYSEKLKERKFKFSDEDLRPYFKLENVIEGAFDHASRLFNLEFKERPDIPIYHPDVKVYEVRDTKQNSYIGLFYTDFFPRQTKKGGAWMTPLREQGIFGGKLRRPHVSIVCNFTKPTADKPSLLTFDEVRTLFHEFGHALHGLLSDCTYRSIAGTNVHWDFVELPSQLMENWVLEKEVLDRFATHYQTGAKMPAELAQKVKDSSNYLAGYAAMRQISFGYLDMGWHSSDPTSIQKVEDFESSLLDKTRVMPKIEGTNTSCSFSHIFSGGYSAGYYSYKWAEVLEADAFEYFKERGLYDAEVADKLRNDIFARGGTEHPMELYKRFRGREPDPDALLRREGLLPT